MQLGQHLAWPFGAFLRFREKDAKALAFGYFVSAIIGGVTEPVLYGIGLRYKRPFLAPCSRWLLWWTLRRVNPCWNLCYGSYEFSSCSWLCWWWNSEHDKWLYCGGDCFCCNCCFNVSFRVLIKQKVFCKEIRWFL